MIKSTHKTEVVRINDIMPHPNADRMEIVKVFGYTCCIGKGEFKKGDLVAYIVPDSIVPDTFPVKEKRIKVKRLRGVYSQGLLIKAPEGSSEGDDVAEKLGITHYEPFISTFGNNERAPSGNYPVYDIDSWYRHKDIFIEHEEVVCTEKIHGCNARFTYQEDRMRCGSRNNWKKQDDENLWWIALSNTPEVEKFCKENPDVTVYGEVYGQVQKGFNYGKGGAHIIVFDLLRNGEWISYDEAKSMSPSLPWVPEVYRGGYSEKVAELADGMSLIPGAKNIREGVVVKPVKERVDMKFGRVQMKIVSNQFLERS